MYPIEKILRKQTVQKLLRLCPGKTLDFLKVLFSCQAHYNAEKAMNGFEASELFVGGENIH